MSAERQRDDGLLGFVQAYREKFARYSLMYAGPNLDTIEAMWHMLETFEDFARDRVNVFDPVALSTRGERPADKAYQVIAQKYRCGSWTLGTKVAHEMRGEVDDRLKAEELIRRLQEVTALRERLRTGEIRVEGGAG